MDSLKLAFVPIARPTFDIPLAQGVIDTARDELVTQQYLLVEPRSLVDDLASVDDIIQRIASEQIDLLLILQSTFADSRMVVRLAEATDAPILLWAVPETPTGGRLRLNSLCGVNLAGHALTLRERQYDYIYANPDDVGAYKKIGTLARAGRVKNMLNRLKVGVMGQHPDGMDTCHLDAQQLEKIMGVSVTQYPLEIIFKKAAETSVDEVALIREKLQAKLPNLNEMEQGPLHGTLQTYHALQTIGKDEHISAFAVRCWPEFFERSNGCAACGAMSLLNDDLTPSACEADVNGTITQYILQSLSGAPAFGADVVSVDLEGDSLVIWHCGKAPLSMADPEVQAEAGIHSNRKVPLVMEFPLKPGRVTVARLSRATGELRLVVGGGEVLKAPKSFTGTSGVIRFDQPAEKILDIILGEGLEHHIAITYGDHVQELLALADLLNLPILRL